MAKIDLPGEILKKEAFKLLPAKEKEEYVSNLLRKILELNPDGITTSQVREATGLTYSTIWHHFEILKSTAQCIKISRGNMDVYYHIGKLDHLNEYNANKATYAISKVKTDKGSFVSIHEKRENRLGNHTICTGIVIPFELIGDIITDLNKLKKSK